MEKINKIQEKKSNVACLAKKQLVIKICLPDRSFHWPHSIGQHFCGTLSVKDGRNRNPFKGQGGGGDGKPMGLSWYKNQALCGFSVAHQRIIR